MCPKYQITRQKFRVANRIASEIIIIVNFELLTFGAAGGGC